MDIKYIKACNKYPDELNPLYGFIYFCNDFGKYAINKFHKKFHFF